MAVLICKQVSASNAILLQRKRVLFIQKFAKCCFTAAQQVDNVCRDVTVLVLDRPRHEQIIKDVRDAGARIKLISDGDVGGAIEVAKLGAPVDVLFGIGGTPEGITDITSVLQYAVLAYLLQDV